MSIFGRKKKGLQQTSFRGKLICRLDRDVVLVNPFPEVLLNQHLVLRLIRIAQHKKEHSLPREVLSAALPQRKPLLE
jgi:hypothetical protein